MTGSACAWAWNEAGQTLGEGAECGEAPATTERGQLQALGCIQLPSKETLPNAEILLPSFTVYLLPPQSSPVSLPPT